MESKIHKIKKIEAKRNFIKNDKGNLGSLLQLAMVITILGILGTIGVYTNEKVSDKTALVSGDTYYNASLDVVDTVETGWDFASIVVLVAAAAVILGMLFGVFGGYMRF